METSQANDQSIIELGSDEEKHDEEKVVDEKEKEKEKEEPTNPKEDDSSEQVAQNEPIVSQKVGDGSSLEEASKAGENEDESIPPSGVITNPVNEPDTPLEVNVEGINACQTCDLIKSQRKRAGNSQYVLCLLLS